MVVGLQKVGCEFNHVKFADQVGSFGCDEVIAVIQRFAEGFDAQWFRSLAEGVEGGDLLLEGLLAGHGWECNAAERGGTNAKSILGRAFLEDSFWGCAHERCARSLRSLDPVRPFTDRPPHGYCFPVE